MNLTRFMEANGIVRIARLRPGYSVAMEGNILGTGETVEEALANARRDRAAQLDERKAA